MKTEFNENNFHAEMGNAWESLHKSSQSSFSLNNIKEYFPMLLGIGALVISIANLIFGLLMRLTAKTVSGIVGNLPWHLAIVLIVLSVVLTLISLICGVISMVSSKSYGKKQKTVSFTLSIVSFVICVVGITINVLCLFI